MRSPDVVAGERRGHEPRAQLLDHIALVHRDRRAQLGGHLGRVQLQARLAAAARAAQPVAWASSSGRWRQCSTTATPSLRSTSTPGSSRVGGHRERLDRGQVRLDPGVGDDRAVDPALQPVLADVRHAVDADAVAQERDRPAADTATRPT